MDFPCPIRSIDLPGSPDVELRGLIVVVGPNSAGKTQLLHDLNEVVLGRIRDLVVASAVVLAPPPPVEEYFDSLIESGRILRRDEKTYRKYSFQYGVDAGAGDFRVDNAKVHYRTLVSAADEKLTGTVPGYRFLGDMGPLLCSALFLRNRLTLLDACPGFDHLNQGPSKTLHSLYWNKNARQELESEIARVFHRAMWVDNTRHQMLVLRVDDSTKAPNWEDRAHPEIMEKYRTIETEGDGLRSYAAICATLLLEQRPLCLIDEPEMCLHPPQADAVGRFIGSHAGNENCTVVATHSSHVFRGILETNRSAHIIRLSRPAKVFGARAISPDLVKEVITKPRSRSESILEGLLSHAVVLCEGEGDRMVYESAYRTIPDRKLDIRFVPSVGTGGFADPLHLYRALGVPCAVIADIDFLAKSGELKRVLTGLGVPKPDLASLQKQASKIVAHIKASMSGIDAVQIQEELRRLAESPIDPTDGDRKLRAELQKLANSLYRLRDLQRRGVEAISEEHKEGAKVIALRSQARALLDDLRRHGLFVVEVGELESWLPVLMMGQSREDKSRWAMLAAQKIEAVGDQGDDVWEFMRSVHSYLGRARSAST